MLQESERHKSELEAERTRLLGEANRMRSNLEAALQQAEGNARIRQEESKKEYEEQLRTIKDKFQR